MNAVDGLLIVLLLVFGVYLPLLLAALTLDYWRKK